MTGRPERETAPEGAVSPELLTTGYSEPIRDRADDDA